MDRAPDDTERNGDLIYYTAAQLTALRGAKSRQRERRLLYFYAHARLGAKREAVLANIETLRAQAPSPLLSDTPSFDDSGTGVTFEVGKPPSKSLSRCLNLFTSTWTLNDAEREKYAHLFPGNHKPIAIMKRLAVRIDEHTGLSWFRLAKIHASEGNNRRIDYMWVSYSAIKGGDHPRALLAYKGASNRQYKPKTGAAPLLLLGPPLTGTRPQGCKRDIMDMDDSLDWTKSFYLASEEDIRKAWVMEVYETWPTKRMDEIDSALLESE